MNFEKIKGKISSILEQTKNKVNEVKDKNQLKTMIERAVEDGELTEEEKSQIVEAIQALGMDEESMMASVNEKLEKVQVRLGHISSINQKIKGLTLVEGQVGKEGFDDIVAEAAEIGQSKEDIEKQLFEVYGDRCLMEMNKKELLQRIAKAATDGKISELESVTIKHFASKYGYTEAEIYTLMAEALKK